MEAPADVPAAPLKVMTVRLLHRAAATPPEKGVIGSHDVRWVGGRGTSVSRGSDLTGPAGTCAAPEDVGGGVLLTGTVVVGAGVNVEVTGAVLVGAGVDVDVTGAVLVGAGVVVAAAAGHTCASQRRPLASQRH